MVLTLWEHDDAYAAARSVLVDDLGQYPPTKAAALADLIDVECSHTITSDDPALAGHSCYIDAGAANDAAAQADSVQALAGLHEALEGILTSIEELELPGDDGTDTPAAKVTGYVGDGEEALRAALTEVQEAISAATAIERAAGIIGAADLGGEIMQPDTELDEAA